MDTSDTVERLLAQFLAARKRDPATEIDNYVHGLSETEVELFRRLVAASIDSSWRLPSSDPGTVVAGRYELTQRVAATVWLASDRKLDRTVVVKLPDWKHQELSGHDAFEREARLIASVRHPGVPVVVDVGHDPCYLVMEFVEGTLLSRLLERTEKEEDPPPSGEDAGQTVARSSRQWFPHVARIMVSLSEALEAVHESGVVHRDLKPSNIIVRPDGQATLLGFGLARSLDDQSDEAEHLAGTLFYMAPEHARRPFCARGTTSSDIYQLGVIMYEVLTGERAFHGTGTFEILRNIESGPLRRPRQCDPRIPRTLEDICLRAMDREPLHRYRSSWDLRNALIHFLDVEPIAHKSVVISGSLALAAVLNLVGFYQGTPYALHPSIAFALLGGALPFFLFALGRSRR